MPTPKNERIPIFPSRVLRWILTLIGVDFVISILSTMVVMFAGSIRRAEEQSKRPDRDYIISFINYFILPYIQAVVFGVPIGIILGFIRWFKNITFSWTLIQKGITALWTENFDDALRIVRVYNPDQQETLETFRAAFEKERQPVSSANRILTYFLILLGFDLISIILSEIAATTLLFAEGGWAASPTMGYAFILGVLLGVTAGPIRGIYRWCCNLFLLTDYTKYGATAIFTYHYHRRIEGGMHDAYKFQHHWGDYYRSRRYPKHPKNFPIKNRDDPQRLSDTEIYRLLRALNYKLFNQPKNITDGTMAAIDDNCYIKDREIQSSEMRFYATYCKDEKTYIVSYITECALTFHGYHIINGYEASGGEGFHQAKSLHEAFINQLYNDFLEKKFPKKLVDSLFQNVSYTHTHRYRNNTASWCCFLELKDPHTAYHLYCALFPSSSIKNILKDIGYEPNLAAIISDYCTGNTTIKNDNVGSRVIEASEIQTHVDLDPIIRPAQP